MVVPILKILALFLLSPTCVRTASVFDLSGCHAHWELSNNNRSIVLPVRVPSNALQIVSEHNLVGDPLNGSNEVNCQWVAEETWTFKTMFAANETSLTAAHIDLALIGVDTAAEVLVNGQLVAQLSNAFREYHFPVKHLLSASGNELTVTIHPASQAAQARHDKYPYDVPTMSLPHMIPHYNFLRKPPADFGWDWGPALAPAGIFGGVLLVAYNTVYITGVNVRQRHHQAHVELIFDVMLKWAEDREHATVSIQATGNTKWAAQKAVAAPVELHHVQVNITQPYDLWWPVGYGSQTMYNFTISVTSAHHPPLTPTDTAPANRNTALNTKLEKNRWSASDARPSDNSSAQDKCRAADGVGSEEEHQPAPYSSWGGEHAATVTRRIGLREVEVRREKLQDGESFYFIVNGVPIYAKGANMIIADVIASKATPERYRNLVESAVAAHMNMIRVWGGGLYPPQEFYDYCDEMGVLVWQEAMMACALYPRDAAFLQQIHEEVQFQMRRINWHPSVVIWGGNNEVETAMDGWFPESQQNPQLYVADYVKLFLDTVHNAVAEVDPDFPFVDSSPSNGLLSTEPYVKRWGDASSPFYGDVHYYNYDADSFAAATYPHARFVSEFGFESLPSWKLYKQVTQPEDWSWNSKMSEFRMRHPNGTLQLLDQAQRHFNISVATATSSHAAQHDHPDPEVFRRWTYVTQLQQAITYETAIGLWRRLKGTAAHTMGVLYWQLNDVWLGASWSSMDFGGNWRILHYTMKKTYAPFVVVASSQDDSSEIWAVNDINEPVTGTVKWELIALDCRTGPIMSHTQNFSLEALQSKALHWPQLTHLLHSVFNSTSSSSSYSSSSSSSTFSSSLIFSLVFAPSAAMRLTEKCTRLRTMVKMFLNSVGLHAPPPWGSKRCPASGTGLPHAANAIVRVQAEIDNAPGSEGITSVSRGSVGKDLPQPALNVTGKNTLSQHQCEVMVNQSTAPNRRFLQQLHGVPHLAVLDALSSMPRTSEIVILNSELKDKQVVSNPDIAVNSFRLLSPVMAEFVITSIDVALNVAIDTVVKGRFSDNNFVLLPWEPKVMAFLYDHSVTSMLELQESITVLSLADTTVTL